MRKVARTNIGQNNLFARIVGQLIMRAIAIPASAGAKASLYLATAPEVEGNGGYYKECRLTTPKPQALDDASAARLWDISEQLVGLARVQVAS